MKRAVFYMVLVLSLATAHTALAQRKGALPSQPPAPPNSEPDQPEANEPNKPDAVHMTKVEPAEWAPADSLCYLGITDVSETWDGFKKTGAYAVMNDPAAAEALAGLNPFVAAVGEFQGRLAKLLDVTPAQLKNPFGGPLTFYVSAPRGAKPEAIEIGLVAGVGDAELMKTYYGAAVAKLKPLGTHEAVTVDKDTIDVFTTSPGKPKKDSAKSGDDEFDKLDRGKPGALAGSPDQMFKKGLDQVFSADNLPAKFAVCLTKDRLIVASTADQVKAVLQGEKRARTLADTDDYQALLRNLRPTGTVRFLVNLPRVLDMVKGAADDAEKLRSTLKTIGSDCLGSVVGHARFGASSYDSKMELLFLMNGQRSGLAKLLSPENGATAPPAIVSAGTCLYAGCNVNVPQLLDDIEQMLRASDPEGADKFRAFLEPKQLPTGETVNYRKDFLEHLRGPITLALGFSRPLGPNCGRFLFALGHKDQAAITAFLAGPGSQGMLQPRDLRGNQVFDLPPIPPVLPPGLALTSTADRLVLGNAPVIEAALTPATGDALSATSAWKRVARVIPEQAWLTVYMDSRSVLDAAAELNKKKEEPAAAGAGGPDITALLMSALMQTAPGGAKGGDSERADKLAKYATQAVYTVSTTPAGVQVTAVQLRPEK